MNGVFLRHPVFHKCSDISLLKTRRPYVFIRRTEMSYLFVVTTQMLNFCGRATKISAHYATASLSDSLAFIVLHIIKRFIIALLALPAEDAEQGLCGLRRASVRPFFRRTPLLRVCCCGPGGQEISIDRGGRRAPQQHGAQQHSVRRANAGSATLSAYVVAEHRLVLAVLLYNIN